MFYKRFGNIVSRIDFSSEIAQVRQLQFEHGKIFKDFFKLHC